MAKQKKRRKRQGLFSKAVNIGLIALAFSRAIRLALAGSFDTIIFESTFGLAGTGGGGQAGGTFNLDAGLRMYAPAGAAIGLGKLKQYLMRHFPVR